MYKRQALILTGAFAVLFCLAFFFFGDQIVAWTKTLNAQYGRRKTPFRKRNGVSFSVKTGSVGQLLVVFRGGVFHAADGPAGDDHGVLLAAHGPVSDTHLIHAGLYN